VRAPVVGIGLVASLGAGVAVLVRPGSATLTLQVLSGFLAVLAGTVIVRLLASLYPLARVRRESAVVPAPDRLAAELGRLQRQVELGLATAADAHAYLRPVLRELASRLLLVHGVELDGQPVRAQELLGAELWELVRPSRPQPMQPLAAGMSGEQLASVLDRLEAL
jgi:hypothetical protein